MLSYMNLSHNPQLPEQLRVAKIQKLSKTSKMNFSYFGQINDDKKNTIKPSFTIKR
jgi:hypothetical protein